MPISLLVTALAVAAPLMAMGFERWPGLAPCELCLWQRWPYWVAAALALVSACMPPGARLWLLRLAGVAVLVSGGIAAMHVGVEQHWWPSPSPSCLAPSVGASVSVEDLMRSLAPTPNKPCDEPAYLIPGLPLSLPAMNLIYALALAGWIFRRSLRRDA